MVQILVGYTVYGLEYAAGGVFDLYSQLPISSENYEVLKNEMTANKPSTMVQELEHALKHMAKLQGCVFLKIESVEEY